MSEPKRGRGRPRLSEKEKAAREAEKKKNQAAKEVKRKLKKASIG